MSTAQRRQTGTAVRSSAQVEAVMRASRALIGIAAASIAEVDGTVTVPQLRVLVIIDTRGPQNLAAVAAALEVNPSNASRTCDRLIKAGLLNRQESAADRRHITLTLTKKGKDLVDRVSSHRRQAISRVLRRMPADQRGRLAEALDTFASAAGEPSGEDAVVVI
jgi:DNA-binding MarR family transcriptional regulator